MDRARPAVMTALCLVMLAAVTAIAGSATDGQVSMPAVAPAAAVGWSPSTLVVSEVKTGGASASDEFVELANAGAAAVDLAGLEIAYVTSTGGTVTRKAAWATTTILEPGRHLLLANGSGAHAGTADVVYSGGLAASGGTIVLRAVGGAPLDAVGWGDATNAFVEGSAVPAPAAGSSIERRPGGALGNGTDSNDNAADWFARLDPDPQNLAAPAVPAPAPTPLPSEPSATPEPSAIPTATPTSTEPAATATPGPTGSPAPTPVPSATPGPTAEPSLQPSAGPGSSEVPLPTALPSDTPAPTASPLPSPTASVEPPSPSAPAATPTVAPTSTPMPTDPPPPTASPDPVLSILEARALPDGSAVSIVGVLTAPLGVLEAGRGGYVEDASAGIALYFDAAPAVPLPAGTLVHARGVVDDRYHGRTLRLTSADLADLGMAPMPGPLLTATGVAGESQEGRRVAVAGVTSGSPTDYADGTGILVDDGSGSLRVIVAPAALGGRQLPAGATITAIGPLGQRDSGTTGTTGYRLFVTDPLDLVVEIPTPTPLPTATPVPTSPPSPDPTAAPSSSPTASPGPSDPPGPVPSASTVPTEGIAIDAARRLVVGSRVTVSGVVTAEAGRLGSPSLLAIDDGTAGIVVRLPADAHRPSRGARLVVSGVLADPYGQLEVRPSEGGLVEAGMGSLPDPLAVGAAEVGERIEGSLVTIVGTILTRPRKGAGGDLLVEVIDLAGGRARVAADGSSRIGAASLRAGETYRLTGIVGQRQSRKGVLDGYRLWLRDVGDTVRIARPGPAAEPGATPAATGGGASAGSAFEPIALAIRSQGSVATVEGIVTTGATLLDRTGRRIVIEDASAAVEVLLPAGVTPPAVGSRIRVTGESVRSYGAPRIRATAIQVMGAAREQIRPLVLSGPPSVATEWRLVRISGLVVDVRRLGDRWQAEIVVGPQRVSVSGLSGSGVPSNALIEGHRATVVGIVRRPYPTATDRRFSVVPRSRADIALGPAESSARNEGTRRPSARAGRAPIDVTPDSGGADDADLAELEQRLGTRVRVGGLVVEPMAGGFTLDDGTATGRVLLRGEAGAYLPLVEPGDAINAVGRVEAGPDGLAVVVDDPAGLSRVGDLGAALILDEGIAAEGSLPPTIGSPTAGPPPSGRLAGLGLDLPGAAGLVTLVVLSAASVAVTLLRQQRNQRRLAATIARRLATVASPRSDARSGHA